MTFAIAFSKFTIVENTLINTIYSRHSSFNRFKLFPEPVIARCLVEWIEIEFTAPRWPVYFVKHCPDSFLISFWEKPWYVLTYPNLGCFVHWRRCKYSCPCFGRANIQNCILVSNDRWAWEFYPTCLIVSGCPKTLLDHGRHLWSGFIICFLQFREMRFWFWNSRTENRMIRIAK